ncbi:M15 family metallopeptidase [Cellulomonas hominis]|uniref:M15 family metallopeptidase n=1 Tax=Cellulomonas hominis TaxID=156981 RepID=UPI001B8F4E18|nr:M15 family metallopeptidase [Cellulomonas hominis]VTR76031.1 hypothetical protein CHMI_00787 [Cellulomonas hominis]
MKAVGGLLAVLLAPVLVILLLVAGDDGCAPGSTAAAIALDGTAAHVEAPGLSGDPQVRSAQLSNAAAVMNAAAALGLDVRAQQIAVMTAFGESSLINVAHGDEAAGVTNPDGSATCSVGLFQQQWCLGGYGTREQVMDPTFAATTFYTRLQGVQGWADMAPTLAAHRVQRNADPNHYAKHWDSAVLIVQALTGGSSATCQPEVPVGAGGDAPGGWGGHANGRIPLSALAPVPWAPGQLLRADASQALTGLNNAYRAQFGTSIQITDSYRDFDQQVSTKKSKGNLAATPGTSNHGWGLALDLGGGIERFGTAQHTWMRQNAPTYGWVLPEWAQAGGAKPEAWHWEFNGSES